MRQGRTGDDESKLEASPQLHVPLQQQQRQQQQQHTRHIQRKKSQPISEKCDRTDLHRSMSCCRLSGKAEKWKVASGRRKATASRAGKHKNNTMPKCRRQTAAAVEEAAEAAAEAATTTTTKAEAQRNQNKQNTTRHTADLVRSPIGHPLEKQVTPCATHLPPNSHRRCVLSLRGSIFFVVELH